jgi:hypothetical protein
MNNWDSASCWQDLLEKLIEDPQEKVRIAIQAEVRTVTLERWAKRISRPHEKNMQKLLAALPSTAYTSFAHLVAMDFPGLVQANLRLKRVYEDLPSEFHARILHASAQLPSPMRGQILLDLISQQALEHLDPNRLGMLITLLRFVRPLEEGKVRSLREVGGIGTAPWKYDPGQRTLLLGAESLAGHAVRVFHRVVVPNRTTPTFFPVHWTEHEQSVVAVPITLEEKVAGCLLAASNVPDYFVEGQPPVLIFERYALLASLIFEKRDFLSPQEISLGYMPSEELQIPYFREFNRLVSQQFRLALVRGSYYTLEEARQQVWREIEEALLQAFLQDESMLENHSPS